MSKEKILAFFEMRDNIEEVVRDYVQDTLLPLDERWEIFEKSGFGHYHPFIVRLESLHENIACYDGVFPLERHQNVSVFEILEAYDTADLDTILLWELYGFDPVAFKEECLAKFIRGWVYDW